MIDPAILSKLTFPARYHEYTARDSALYAICAGMAATDPTRKEELRYALVGSDQLTLPTMVTAVAWDEYWVHQIGVDVSGVLHIGQIINIYRPFPASGRLMSRRRIGRVEDRGVDKGAVISLASEIFDAETQIRFADTELIILARGDGGFSHSRPGPARHREDESIGPPHFVEVTPTPQSLALQYRLLGDDNPLHAVPAVATKSGFERPILHGLCTLAIACKHVTSSALHGDARSITSIEARFSGEVYPGETLRTSIWKADEELRFTTIALERARTVLSGGHIRTNATGLHKIRPEPHVTISGAAK